MENKIQKPEDGNGKIKPEQVEQLKPKDITLSIAILAKDNSFELHAPGNGKVYDLPMCLFLLDRAKDMIKAHNAEANQSRIFQGNRSGGIMNFAKKWRR